MFMLCASQVAEEKRLHSEQASALEVVRGRVREEEEEEEARLMEAKQDMLRKLKQQVRGGRQGEEGGWRRRGGARKRMGDGEEEGEGEGGVEGRGRKRGGAMESK